MKTSIKNISKIVGMLLLAAVIVQGCSDVAGPNGDVLDLKESSSSDNNILGGNGGATDDNGNDDDLSGDNVVCTTSGSSVLKASKSSYNAGTVEYEIVGDNLIVTYVPAPGVTITETHLWVGTNINGMPAAGNGAPKNGHFPYNDIVNIIPLADIENYSPDSPLYIVAHAVVEGSQSATFKKEETAYAGDEEGDSKRWFWYIEFTQEEECVEVGDGGGSTGQE